MIKALVFGGAFNPPTRAHIELAYYAMVQTGREKVIFVPSKTHYIADIQKKDAAFSDAARYHMLSDIASDHDWMLVSDYELRSSRQPRTWLTLKHMNKEGYDVRLLFGSDKLKELQTGWLHVEEICDDFGIVCLSRSGDHCEDIIDQDPFLRSLKPFITIVEAPETYQNVSSSLVRRYHAEGKKDEVRRLIPPELGDLSAYQES